jgi:hypothetical protein
MKLARSVLRTVIPGRAGARFGDLARGDASGGLETVTTSVLTAGISVFGRTGSVAGKFFGMEVSFVV